MDSPTKPNELSEDIKANLNTFQDQFTEEEMHK